MKRKTIIFLIIIAMLMVIIPIQSFAGIDTDVTIGNNAEVNSSNAMIRKMLGIVQAIGSVISVVALIIIGFRYMISSVDEKANMKGVIIYYVVGCVLVFATSNIVGVAYDILFVQLKI